MNAATQAPSAAVMAPRMASAKKWFAVATITKVTSKGYIPHTHRVTRCRPRRAIGTPIIRAKATCIEGIAA